jgi:hypothetical protein
MPCSNYQPVFMLAGTSSTGVRSYVACRHLRSGSQHSAESPNQLVKLPSACQSVFGSWTACSSEQVFVGDPWL